MKRIYILLTRTNTNLAKLIRLTTKTEFSHASICLDNEFKEQYSFIRKYIKNPFIGRCMHENIRTGLFKKYEDTDCRIYSTLVTDDEYNSIKESVLKVFNSKKVYKFNNIGLFGCWFDIEIHRKYKRCCSQYVAESISCVKSIKMPRRFMTMRPNDFRYTEGLDCIYSGTIKDIPIPFDENNIVPIIDPTKKEIAKK